MHDDPREMQVRIPSPSGCRWCGIDQREHLNRWRSPIGWHKWTPPTLEQRKERMFARRRIRLQQRNIMRRVA